jgi:hypothetical protein
MVRAVSMKPLWRPRCAQIKLVTLEHRKIIMNIHGSRLPCPVATGYEPSQLIRQNSSSGHSSSTFIYDGLRRSTVTPSPRCQSLRMLQITDTAMISTSMEGILYGELIDMSCTSTESDAGSLQGFAVLMYILTFWILYNNDSKRYPKYILVSMTAALFILTTAVSITLN